MNKIIRRIIYAYEKWRLKDKRFIIISNNCWGSEIYTAIDREYNTPFVGLYIYPDCYIRLLQQFESVIASKLEFTKTSKYFSEIPDYPIGLLSGDIEIHFLHYATEQEAITKWNRRIDRLREAIACQTPLFVKFCDRDGCTNHHLDTFHQLPFENKLSIGVAPYHSPDHIAVPNLRDPHNHQVADGLKLYRKRYQYFDISSWLINGNVKRNFLSRFFALIT